MKPFLKKLQNETHKISLSEAEKFSARQQLSSFMTAHSVRNDAGSRQTWQENIFQTLTFTRMMTNPKFAALAVVGALLVGGAGVSSAAERAIPGDALYPIKVYFNENLRGTLAVSAEKKAGWETKLLERRLQEAAALSAQGKLDAETERALAQDIEEQNAEAQASVASLEQNDDSTASEADARLEAILDAYASLLAILSQSNDNGQSVVVVVNASANAQSSIHVTPDSGNNDVDNEAALRARAEASLRQAEHTIDRVKRALERHTSSVQSAVAVYIEAASATLEDAQTAFDSGLYENAFVLATEAKQLALQAEALADVIARFGITLPSEETDTNVDATDTNAVDTDLDYTPPPPTDAPLVPGRTDPPDSAITPPVTGTYTRPTGPISDPKLDIELPVVNLLRRQAENRIASAEKAITEAAAALQISLKNQTEIDKNPLLGTAWQKYLEAKELLAAESYKKAMIEADVAIELANAAKASAKFSAAITPPQTSDSPTSNDVRNTNGAGVNVPSVGSIIPLNAGSGSAGNQSSGGNGSIDLNTGIVNNPPTSIDTSGGTFVNIGPVSKPSLDGAVKLIR